MNKNLKSNTGITVISLVITIIVMLILAGITITMLTGDNGMLQMSRKAGDESQVGEDIERIINLYNFIPIEAIKNSNVCNKYEKKLILSLREGLRDKNELIRIKNRTIKAKYVTIYKISLFGLPLLKIKRKRNDRWKLLLFWFLPIGRIVKQ